MIKQPLKPKPPLTTPKIDAIDETLRTHSEAWQDAPAEKKSRWWKKINELLDQRLLAMAERDAQAAH